VAVPEVAVHINQDSFFFVFLLYLLNQITNH
jgi:hypothetical protein